ncbi:hypothetical protein [Porphyrobacter sp. YT40]|uniref:hypothetical protein n=1 Tax=Porphyrobacter sp. YT40 TaxID=2547601 RepID=UPI001141D948|nr:hypothetical protein [Porphyrobacter sp. YT40]QDH34613.1 hypothetical protein E2E27_09925 [Porphyrobacter sp. YT40]
MKTLIAAAAALLAAPLSASELVPLPFCTAPDGWSDVVARDPDYIVFGELHGTNEAPAFVENLICVEARQGQRVLLAVEHA